MKRNGMCPFCFIKSLFGNRVVDEIKDAPYENNSRKTPLMGWSTWNTFANTINEDLIYETAQAMKEKGLVDAGYIYINIDDNWQSSSRDKNGEMQADFATFPHGISALAQKVNALGEKLGIYSSNGTLTCEDMPAGLGNEEKDALTFARWGCEYLKYDFCHNVKISKYAPLVYGIEICKLGSKNPERYLCSNAKLDGLAKFMPYKKIEGGMYISGLDAAKGKATFKINVSEDGDYVFTTLIRKYGKKYEKYLTVKVNGDDNYHIDYPGQRRFNITGRFQTIINLHKGENIVELFNPISSNIVSAKIQYRTMANALLKASQIVAEETKQPVKPIIMSICEWGFRKPWLWGYSAGNMWRTTPDIKTIWPWMMLIYNRNVKLFKYSSPSHFNDPDMLEVGNGKLSYDENMSHFALWCMMNAPLVLGNDIRNISKPILDIVTNKDLIQINQDLLCKQAKRIKKGSVDILAKPLTDGIAICFFNRSSRKQKLSFEPSILIKDDYIAADKEQLNAHNIKQIVGEIKIGDKITTLIPKHGVVVFKYIDNKEMLK